MFSRVVASMALTFFAIAPVAVSDAEGFVVLNPGGCGGRYVVESSMGFAILEWYGGHDPIEGEWIAGEFESHGFQDVYFENRRTGRVWVEDFWLSQNQTAEKMREYCS